MFVDVVERGERLEAFPVGQGADSGVGGDQVVQVGGAAAGQPADDDGSFDRNGLDFGMRGDQCFQPEPVHQVAYQLFERDRHAGL